jgi:hypothetical protein
MEKMLIIMCKESCSLLCIKDFDYYKIEKNELIVYKNSKCYRYSLDIISSINVKYEVD